MAVGNAYFDTAEFYRESCEKGFVKRDAIARNVVWETPTRWGDLQITINLSKPEKDPRDIAAAAALAASGEPSFIDPATGVIRPCSLCVTQADLDCGYARTIPIGGETWGMWFSPYGYYNEHCIAMSWQHRPMHVDRASFTCLLDFVDLFPHYFIGSNADLPIVGGSILAHDHFQGGCHVFPMDVAPIDRPFDLPAFPDVAAGVLRWPVSVVRLTCADRTQLLEAATRVHELWCGWDDERVGIVSSSDGVRHNTTTPIVRRRGEAYEMDLALRCNITSPEHPLGVFHPHENLHHIKKENIGLIEVMGRAILPPRVEGVMATHALGRDDVGNLFAHVLEDAGVYKWDAEGRAAFDRFVDAL